MKVNSDVFCKASHDSLVKKFPNNSDLTCNHEHVVLHTGITCDLASGIASEASIEHFPLQVADQFCDQTLHLCRRILASASVELWGLNDFLIDPKPWDFNRLRHNLYLWNLHDQQNKDTDHTISVL